VVREARTCSLGKRVQHGQVMGRGNHGNVPHRGCQGGQLGLDVGAIPVPAEKGMDGVRMPQVMYAGFPAILGSNAGPAEK
jgi:hypothetical protein